jgi:hypothetical protein
MGDAALALPVAAAPPGEPEAVGVEPRGVVVAAAPPVVAAGVVADVEAVLGYSWELAYVVQEEVAGMTTGAPPGGPGGAWLSPRQERNSLGA